MQRFAKRLRERARELDLSDAEVARRSGLAERRYGHYVRGTRQPDFETLVRICAVLDITPNDLLMPADRAAPPEQERWLSRLIATARKLRLDDLGLAVRQIEAIAEHRQAANSPLDQPPKT
jgi:transcriptional regulator with XRE-family HTH domain